MRRLATATTLAIGLAGLAFAPQPPAPSEVRTPSAVFEPEGLMERAEHDCTQATPAATSANAVTGGNRITIHVRLVLDLKQSRALDAVKDNPNTSVNERQAAINAFGRDLARDHLAIGAQAYDAIDINLSYASFDVLHAPDLKSGQRAATMEGRESINLVKQQYGGVRPSGTDVVYVVTDRDLTDAGSSLLAGLADCIGGITYPGRAFATGEFNPNAEFSIGVAFNRHFSAKVAAHEIGHLLGAHHHYQACGPYAITNYVGGHGAGACTLMTNLVDLATLPLSPLNQVIVRGHAEEWGAANDTSADG